MTLDKLVEDNYHQLNENDLYIWQYILHHKRECQRISIKDLARNCNVSHTSILRFTKKLGLEGFSELKVHLKWDLAQKPNFKPRNAGHVVQQDVPFGQQRGEDMLDDPALAAHGLFHFENDGFKL